MKILNKALYTIFLFFLAISNFPLLANDEKINIELALEHNLTHLPGAFNLIRAIRPHLAALKIKSETKESKKSVDEIKAFSAQFINDNLEYIQTIKFNNNKDNLDRWALYNLFRELYDQTAEMKLPDDRYLIVKKFYDAIIDAIAKNNEKTKVLLFCLRHIYFDFCGFNGEARNEGIFSSIQTTIAENKVEDPEALLRNVEACVMCVLREFTYIIKHSKAEVTVKNELTKHNREYFSNVSSILKKLINNYAAASKEKVDNNQQASNGSKKSSKTKKHKKKKKKIAALIQSQPISLGKKVVEENSSKMISTQAATSEIVISGPWSTLLKKVRAPFIKIQKEDPIISPDYEGPDVGPIDLPVVLIEEREISAEPPLKIDATFKFLSANTEKENIVLLHRLFTKLKEQRTVENSKEQDKLIEKIANNNPHLFYQITLIKIIYFAEYNDSHSFEQLVFNSMKNFFNTYKPKPWVMKKTLGRVIKFYQKFEALNIEQNENKIKKGVEILKEIQREFKAGKIYFDLGSFSQKCFARITESNNIIAPVSFRKNNEKLNIIEVKETSDDVPSFYREDFGDDYRIITPQGLLKGIDKNQFNTIVMKSGDDALSASYSEEVSKIIKPYEPLSTCINQKSILNL